MKKHSSPADATFCKTLAGSAPLQKGFAAQITVLDTPLDLIRASSVLRLLEQLANLRIRFYERLPTEPLRIVHAVLPVDPADIRPGLVDQALLVGITVMPTSSVTPIQVLRLFRQMHIAAAQPALRTWKCRQCHTSEANQLRVLVALPAS